MNGRIASALMLLAVAIVILNGSLYRVLQTERAVVLRFGALQNADVPPGLHVKIPLVDEVRTFEGRVLTLDATPESYYTVGKKRLEVDSFAKWRIANVEKYYTATGGDETIARNRLAARINDGLRNQFGTRTLHEVVSGERDQFMAELAAEMNASVLESLGVEVLDVRVKRIDLPREVSESVFNRMSAEREKLATEYRAQGQESAEKIRADADRQVTILEAEAYRDAEQTRGDGDARATAIYSSAFGKDPEFYSFTRSLRAYVDSFSSRQDILLLDTESEFFKYLDKSRATP